MKIYVINAGLKQGDERKMIIITELYSVFKALLLIIGIILIAILITTARNMFFRIYYSFGKKHLKQKVR